MTAAFRRGRFILVALLAALLVSCTFNKFAYNQADTVASWMVNDYFDLDGAQKTEFQQRFERFHGWHRRVQLPEYAQFMRTARTRMQGELTREDVLWFIEGLRERVRLAGRQAAPEAAALLASLTPAQIEHLQRKLERSNRKYASERKLSGSLEERYDEEAKRVVKQIEQWLAPLNREQEARVKALVRAAPAMHQQHYADRLRRQKALFELLKHRGEDRERFTQRVTEWMVHWERGRPPEYRKELQASWERRADMLAEIHRTFTPEQRNASLQRINTYAEDFVQLSRQGDSGSDRTAAAR